MPTILLSITQEAFQLLAYGGYICCHNMQATVQLMCRCAVYVCSTSQAGSREGCVAGGVQSGVLVEQVQLNRRVHSDICAIAQSLAYASARLRARR